MTLPRIESFGRAARITMANSGDRSAWISWQGTVRGRFGLRLGRLEHRRQAVKIGVEIAPKIIEENGAAVARDILRDKIEGKASPGEQLIAELKKRRNSS